MRVESKMTLESSLSGDDRAKGTQQVSWQFLWKSSQ